VSPHGDWHEASVKTATKATEQFIHSFSLQYAELTDVQSRWLLGVYGGPSFGVVMDTTESMQGIIDNVVKQVKSQTDLLKNDAMRPSAFILVPFNDPSVGPFTVANDYSDFESSDASKDVSIAEPHRYTFATAQTEVLKTLKDEGDLVPAEIDNCPEAANNDQLDSDDDGIGDACDPDKGCSCRVPGASASPKANGWLLVVVGLFWLRRYRGRRKL
jgi:MYXO-CTERM domain-containing protein